MRYPAGGLTREQVVEIRRIKARVETERLPRGADPATHTKLGRGGLADVEWAVQLLQLRHAGTRCRRCARTRTLDALAAARDAGPDRPGGRRRDGRRLDAGRAGPQRADAGPRPRRATSCPGTAWSWPGWSGCSAHDDPGEFLDEYLRTGRRSRAAAERVLEA